MKYKNFLGKKYDQKKWDAYVEKEKKCFSISSKGIMIMFPLAIILLPFTKFGYIALAFALLFSGRWSYLVHGACKASKK